MVFETEFIAEATRRFHLDKLASKAEDTILRDIGRRYVSSFSTDGEVLEKYPTAEKLMYQTALHCYYGGLIVALYELTEGDYAPSEKTFAVLTNMDTVFFSGLMFARWNVKKRYANYQTDFMADALYRLAKSLLAEGELNLHNDKMLTAMTMLFLAGAATDVTQLEAPYADTEGI